MSSTDLEAFAEGLLISADNQAETEAETEDATPEEEVETEEVEVEDDTAEESEADEEKDHASEDVEDDEDTEDEAEGEAPETVTVMIDGKATEVSLDDLKRDYSGQAYIQKKMEENAETKKQLDEALRSLQAEQAKILEAAKAQAEGAIAKPTEPDVSMLSTDPIGYMEAKAKYDVELKAYEAQQEQIMNLQKDRDAKMMEQHQRQLAEEGAKLQQLIPEFADPQKAEAMRDSLVKVATDAYGFKSEEVAGFTDARALKVLHDAMKWNDLQKAKAQPKAKPKRNVKPKAHTETPKKVVRQKQREQARKSGKLEDFAALLME